MNTPLRDLRHHATRIEENDKLKDFIRLCIAVGCTQGMGDDMHTRLMKTSPRLNSILSDPHRVYELTPQEIRNQKAIVGVGETTGGAWGDSLAAYQVVANAFAESLKNFGAFDAMLAGGMRRVPLHSRVGMATVGFTGATVNQNAPKPISNLSISATTVDEKKAVVMAVITDELARFSSETAGTLFTSELQAALAVETDETFIAILTSGQRHSHRPASPPSMWATTCAPHLAISPLAHGRGCSSSWAAQSPRLSLSCMTIAAVPHFPA